MDNLNDTNLTVDNLDLSGIPGIEEFLPGNAAQGAEEVEYVTPSEDSSEDSPISWSKFAEDLPEPLHETFKPIVDEWSRQYNRVSEEASPYYNLREQGFTPEEIEMAANLQRALANDPEGFYSQMGQAYGFAQQQQLQELQQQVQELSRPAPRQASTGTGNWWEEEEETQEAQQPQQIIDPRFEQLESELEQLRAMQEEVFERQRLDEGRSQMEYELATIRTKYGEFDEEEVVRRALANYNLEGDASLARAFHEVKDFEQRVAQRVTTKRSQAPKVMGSANGVPPAAAPAAINTEDARRQAALELAIRMGAIQGNVR
jgi:hypothetical protein